MTNYRMAGIGKDQDFEEEVIVATHPAPAGTFIVYAHKDGSHDMVPVVLWGALQDGTPVPISLTGAWDGVENRNNFVLHPDGYCSAYEKSWASLDLAVTATRELDT